MGKIKQGILGAVSGKVGSVVGSSWKGIATLRSLAASVANPRTAPQVNARTKFTGIVKFASQILAEIVKPLWDRFAQQESGYNAFIRRNYDASNNLGVIDPTLIVTSQGKMSSTGINTATADISSDDIGVTWSNDSGQGFKLATDVAYLTIFNTTTGEVRGYSNPSITRATGNISLFWAPVLLAHIHYAYLSFKRVDGTIVSDSSLSLVTVTP